MSSTLLSFLICCCNISIASSLSEVSMAAIACCTSCLSLITSLGLSKIKALSRPRSISTVKSCTTSSIGSIALFIRAFSDFRISLTLSLLSLSRPLTIWLKPTPFTLKSLLINISILSSGS